MLTTAGQVVLRFSQYAEYPARAVLMSRKYNPDTYYQEVVRFLHVDAKALDSGYCQPLRREALGAAGRSSGSQTEAILHLLSQPVQEELSTIAMAIESSTLDVERKHNLDRRSEAPRVASVSKASRDAFVRQWRTESRATAQLYWEKAKPNRRKRFWSHRPLQRLLEEYVEEHKEELEAEMARRHACAQQGLGVDGVTSWPQSKAEWLRWLEREQATYDVALQLVKAGVRRAVNVRVTPIRMCRRKIQMSASSHRLIRFPPPGQANSATGGTRCACRTQALVLSSLQCAAQASWLLSPRP